MAIKITTPNDRPDARNIEIDNGHLTSLQKIVKDYNLKGEKEALNFMLAALDTANGKKIEIDGNSYLPSDDLKNPEKPKDQ